MKIPLTITSIIGFESPEAMQATEALLRERIDLNYVFKINSYTWPGGVETVSTNEFRMGDYFEKIEISNDPPNGLKLTFHKLPGAGNYWKDLLVRTVTLVRDKKGTRYATVLKVENNIKNKNDKT